MPLTFEQLSARIAETRAERGLSQTELASRLGMDPSTVSRIEAGTRRVSAYELVALADALEVDVKELVGEKQVPDTFAVALRADSAARIPSHVDWFKEAVEDYLALRKLTA